LAIGTQCGGRLRQSVENGGGASHAEQRLVCCRFINDSGLNLGTQN